MTKDELLAHYAQREPKRFLQLDSFLVHGRDDVLHPDEDGDTLGAMQTFELMVGAYVRVLIPGDSDLKIAVRQLTKIASWLAENPCFLADQRHFIITKPMGNEHTMISRDEIEFWEDIERNCKPDKPAH